MDRLILQIEDTDTPEQIGDKLAARFAWDGCQITRAFLAALTDANFHTLVAQIEQLAAADGLNLKA